MIALVGNFEEQLPYQMPLWLLFLRLEEKASEALSLIVYRSISEEIERPMMPGIVLTFPILAGKVEAWRRFCQELSGSRRRMYEASRQRMGITRERLALVETAFGSTAVTTLEA